MSAVPSEATRHQIKAARPEHSTWLSANAGSGKTRVLTDRVARLLLKGVDPQNILCLTYTKAAASEMQNRLLTRLGAWAMKPDAELAKELAELGALPAHDPSYFATARRLFAKAIETPGGLRIQTIHSFCASLLRRFPLEAGVTPQFTEMDDRSAAQLRAHVADEMAASDDAALMQDVLAQIGGSDFDKFTVEIVSNKAQFGLCKPAIWKHFDLEDGYDADALLSEVFLGGEIELVSQMLPMLAAGSSKDQGAHAKLARVQSPGLSALPVLESAFLTGESANEPFTAKLESYATKATRAALEPLQSQIEPLILRVEAARPKRLALAAAEATLALHRFAAAFLVRYEAAKARRGWLDFDDFITRASALLTDKIVADWVLYRLDGGLDHILVDEAQDTSPEQWAVIEALAREITAGEGAEREAGRTIFVVGDPKQSIYSFQGADSAEFERMHNTFETRLAHHEFPLVSETLRYSFRSAPAVLQTVDAVFKSREESGFPTSDKHIAFHADMPGRVDIWTPFAKAEKLPDVPWYEPIDILRPNDPVRLLAQEIAQNIRSTIDAETLLPTKRMDDGTWSARPVHEGDFLVLLQRRSALFHEIIRACKLAGLDVAGADRLRIGAEISVKDIIALLQFLALQEDDLSLAAALRSPLFGWSEQDLFSLAHGRKGYLWEALRAETETHSETLAILNDLRKVTDILRPYELIERLLTQHNGRRKILERRGFEAEDALDAFLDLALEYERTAVPSLTGFLSWLESDDPEVKRQIESGGRRIRVMTVHGSKGLEAPIVILPDTADRKNEFRGKIVPTKGRAFLSVAKDIRPPLLSDAIDDRVEAQAAERDRLLYVAMTRAEKWLIIAAAGALDREASWFNQVSNAAENLPFEAAEADGPLALRFESGDWSALAVEKSAAPPVTDLTLEAHFERQAPTPPKAKRHVTASNLPGPKALPGEHNLDEETAKRYGTKVHLLLEHLPQHPPEAWESLADSLLAPLGHESETAIALAEASLTLRNPSLSHIFAADVLSEVPLTAPSATLGEQLHGTIDKLIVTKAAITAIDIKTNAAIPAAPHDVPLGILRQMGAYSEALAHIYPGREIKTAILWTKAPSLMELPHDIVMHAFEDTTYLDAPLPTP